MQMHLETRNRQAFELVRQAQAEIDRFNESKEHARLSEAVQRLNQALQADPKYLRALYYRGMVNDLMGKANRAVNDFTQVLEANPPFTTEVKYNLGVSYFHRYGHENFEKAVNYFEAAAQRTDSVTLRLLAEAGIAHAYAVWMIPTCPSKDPVECEKYFQSEDATKHVEHFYELAIRKSNEVSAALKENNGLCSEDRNEIKWRLCNTYAVVRMFYTDYHPDANVIELLEEALAALRKANRYSPKNWSVYCNLGSTYMRLGYWCKSENSDQRRVNRYFGKALDRLNQVTTCILPDYGFALYEMGRVYRLWGNFPMAIHFFNASKKITENRTVSDKTLDTEITRAVKHDSTTFGRKKQSTLKHP